MEILWVPRRAVACIVCPHISPHFAVDFRLIERFDTRHVHWIEPFPTRTVRHRFPRLEATAWWSWSDSNQPPECYGTWFESDQLPWSDTHPDRRALLFSVIILAAGRTRTSNQIFKESGSSPTSPPRRTYSLVSVSAETTFYWACHLRFSLPRKFPFLEIENPIAETPGGR